MDGGEIDGLWLYIWKNSPPPERDEIKQMIGFKVVDENKVSSQGFSQTQSTTVCSYITNVPQYMSGDHCLLHF
jgi:hypothetical protein